MGIRVEPPHEIGDNCDAFGPPQETPKFVYVTFFDIITCPGALQAPNGSTFKLQQEPLSPCLFNNRDTIGPWDIDIQLIIGPIRARIRMFRGQQLYFNVINAGFIGEYDTFQDLAQLCGNGFDGHSGVAFPFWLDVVAGQVTQLNLPTDGDGLFLEFQGPGTGGMVNRFANTTYGLNKKVLFTP